MSPQPAALFVYGTLAPGRPNAHILAPLGGTWRPATLRGRLHAEGWGATGGFPGLVVDPQGPEVRGLLFTAPGLEAFWPTLDAFEGSDYARTAATAQSASGAEACWVYALARDPRPAPVVGRFAPTTSGRAHPGTLLAGLLAWLDARSRGGRFLLRLEDIDPTAGDPERQRGLVDDLEWFGLDWDEVTWQSARRPGHEALVDTLAAQGLVYECDCSRTVVKAAGRPSAAGGWAYPGTCRPRRVTDWRSSPSGLRVDLGALRVELTDESGLDLSQVPAEALGDPLIRRPDGGFTYQLAVVADDAADGVTRIVRGRDLASSTATQVALRGLAGLPVPAYRHHLLLLEPRGEKLAKLHQSIGADVLRRHYSAAEMAGWLALASGLRPTRHPVFVPVLGGRRRRRSGGAWADRAG